MEKLYVGKSYPTGRTNHSNFTSYLGTSLLVYDSYQKCVEIVPCASHTRAGSTPNSIRDTIPCSDPGSHQIPQPTKTAQKGFFACNFQLILDGALEQESSIDKSDKHAAISIAHNRMNEGLKQQEGPKKGGMFDSQQNKKVVIVSDLEAGKPPKDTTTSTNHTKGDGNAHKKEEEKKKKDRSLRKGLSSKKKSTGSVDPDGSNSSVRSNNSSGSKSIASIIRSGQATPWPFMIITVLIGAAAAGAFMGLGISSANQQQLDEFKRVAHDTVGYVEAAFEDYVHACSLVHAFCRHRNFTRRDFREIHEYLVDSGLSYKSVQFDPNITHDEREFYENEAREYYAENYPHVEYQGFRGFNTLDSKTLEPRTPQPFYFPIHYQEPIVGNEAAIDLDYYSSESRIRAVQALFETEGPSLTDRLSLVRQGTQRSRCGDFDVDASYGVVLMHPGVALDNPQPGDEIWPKDFSSIVLCIPDLLKRATQIHGESSIVYIHDRSTPDYVSTEPVFLGGVKVITEGPKDLDVDNLVEIARTDVVLQFLNEVSFSDIGVATSSGTLRLQENVQVANRIWTVTVQSLEGSYQPRIIFVVVGGVIIFFASVALSFWLYANHKRTAKLQRMQSEAEQERASLILSSARNAAKAERELNDFIAHEIRNPVAAAMAATNFIRLELDAQQPLKDQESLETAREDVGIVDNALKFVNDLLRNMLDMHRASTKQLQVTLAPTDLLHDVLEPVGGMLYQRGSKVKLIVDCPPDLYVMTDCLRLKQVVMNLGRNSSKFIDEGFIRLKAEVVETSGHVKVYVDDSGCGIPMEKRRRLFAKYQESLDLLNQGTGIGLYLCKLLVELMGGEIGLDDDYDSGIPGHPGARFVIDLQTPPIEAPLSLAQIETANGHGGFTYTSKDGHTYTTQDSNSDAMAGDDNSLPLELPEELNVLFVDDDGIIRKLFSRTVKNLCPKWKIREAASGETALTLIEQMGDPNFFDIIFVDMYMASVEKQMLGTETIQAMRQRGVTKSRICGLSANDKEDEFIDAGADSFLVKPFSCETLTFSQDLSRVLYGDPGKEVDGSQQRHGSVTFA